MRITEHEQQAKDIETAMITGSCRRFALLVMNEAELEFYKTFLIKALYGKTTHEQTEGKHCYKIRTRNGTNLRIINCANPRSFECYMCGVTLDHWWATTELLPESIVTSLRCCSMMPKLCKKPKEYEVRGEFRGGLKWT